MQLRIQKGFSTEYEPDIALLKKLLTEKDACVRECAVRAVSPMGSPAQYALPQINGILQYPEKNVRDDLSILLAVLTLAALLAGMPVGCKRRGGQVEVCTVDPASRPQFLSELRVLRIGLEAEQAREFLEKHSILNPKVGYKSLNPRL